MVHPRIHLTHAIEGLLQIGGRFADFRFDLDTDLVTEFGNSLADDLSAALALTGESKMYGLFGGFHLNGPLFEPLIDRVCADLAELQPSLVVPAHCTGWRAQHALARTFGTAYVPDCVGTRFIL